MMNSTCGLTKSGGIFNLIAGYKDQLIFHEIQSLNLLFNVFIKYGYFSSL